LGGHPAGAADPDRCGADHRPPRIAPASGGACDGAGRERRRRRGGDLTCNCRGRRGAGSGAGQRRGQPAGALRRAVAHGSPPGTRTDRAWPLPARPASIARRAGRRSARGGAGMHVVATAGHVDHGKSTLVRRLTGMEPDRWAEERRRGLTIDLGFAWTRLAGGAPVAFVDVPGHQRFVPNMLAGAGPVPAGLSGGAADEGWREQSAEHLAALDALGVRHGLLAVTRSDLADPGPALAEAAARLAATSLGAVPAVAVSGVTGAGLDGLRARLADLVACL